MEGNGGKIQFVSHFLMSRVFEFSTYRVRKGGKSSSEKYKPDKMGTDNIKTRRAYPKSGGVETKRAMDRRSSSSGKAGETKTDKIRTRKARGFIYPG